MIIFVFFKLGKFVQHLANVNQTWRSKIFTYEHFYSRILKNQLKLKNTQIPSEIIENLIHDLLYKNPEIIRDDDLRPKKKSEYANVILNEL